MGSKKYCRKANRTAKNSVAKPEGQLVLAWREAGAAMDEAGRTLLMATFGAVKTTALGLGVCGVLETGKVHDLRLEAHGHPPVRPHEAGTALVCIPRERARAKHHRHRPHQPCPPQGQIADELFAACVAGDMTEVGRLLAAGADSVHCE